jgi:formate hydrogenlyase subunit 3/multisubunit Na+/H+ antiporter MnhD subunit
VPLWGIGFFIAILVLIGVAPFSVFMSEFLIAREAFFQHRYGSMALFLLSALAVFVSALKHAIDVSFGSGATTRVPLQRARIADTAIVVVFVAALILLGLWIPGPLSAFLHEASAIVNGGSL